MLCDYGCGQEAFHQMSSGKWCCSRSQNSCPVVRRKNSESSKGTPSGMLGKKHSQETKEKIKNKMIGRIQRKDSIEKSRIKRIGQKRSDETKKKIRISKLGKNKLTIEQIEERYPLFFKIEEMKYKPLKEKEIQIHCKNHNCENSKEKGGWFTPTKSQLYERIRHLERKDGNDGSYFYCSQKCKHECVLYNLHSDPNKEIEKPYTQEEYNIWKQVVLEQDNYECQKCNSKEKLHCHHIHPVKTHPHLTLDPTNGIVLCKKCHYGIGHKTGTECSTGHLANQVC